MRLFLLLLIFTSYVLAQTPEIVAHRGASYKAPENTLAAFKLAWKQGADAIEGDFRITKDGKIICFHDKNTKRVSGENLVIANATWAQLRHLDVGSWKDRKWAGEKIPTLAQVLDIVPPGKKFFLEVKSGVEILKPLVKTLVKSQYKKRKITIISFDSNVIAGIKKALPDITAYWLTSFRKDKNGKWNPSIGKIIKTIEKIGADGLDCKGHRVIDKKFVAQLRAKKLAFHIWTIDDATIARHFKALGVDSITTNKPRFIRDELSK